MLCDTPLRENHEKRNQKLFLIFYLLHRLWITIFENLTDVAVDGCNFDPHINTPL